MAGAACFLLWLDWQQLQRVQDQKTDRVCVRDLDDSFRIRLQLDRADWAKGLAIGQGHGLIDLDVSVVRSRRNGHRNILRSGIVSRVGHE